MTTPIHIGIDAFRLVGSRTSIGTYTRELIAALLPLGFRITLYAPRKEEGSDLASYDQPGDPCSVVYAPKESEPERRPGDLFLWNQRVLPAMLRSHPCDAFIAPYQQVPCFTPGGIPTLVVIHDLCGLRADCGYRFPGRAWTRHYWNLITAVFRATRIVPISESTRADMLRRFPFCRKRLAEPIYNKVTADTVDPGEAALRLAPLAVPADGYVLCFGIPGPRKALSIALQGYVNYRAAGGALPLVLIGVENEQTIRRHLPDEWLSDIRILPRVSTCERDALYRLATCLLFCSRCEGFGYPVVEAMRQGCPVVASATTPAAEITGGTLDLMTRPDATECASLIRRYAEMDPASRQALVGALIDRSRFYSTDTFGSDFNREILRMLKP